MAVAEAEEEALVATSQGEARPTGGASEAVEGASGDTEKYVIAGRTLCEPNPLYLAYPVHMQWRGGSTKTCEVSE